MSGFKSRAGYNGAHTECILALSLMLDKQNFTNLESVWKQEAGQQLSKTMSADVCNSKPALAKFMIARTWFFRMLKNSLTEDLLQSSEYLILAYQAQRKKIETARTPCVEQKFSQIEFVYRNRDGQEDPKGEGKKVM